MRKKSISLSALVGLFLLFIFPVAELQAQITNFPYFESFDSESICPTGCGTACVLGNTGWSNASDDDIDWTVFNSNTPSSNTGADFDHTSGTGNYLYTEASGCTYDWAHLESPWFDLSGVASAPAFNLDFWYHMFGGTMDSLHIDIRTDTVWTLDIVSPFTDNQNLWQQKSVSLIPWLGDTVQIRFRGRTGSSFTSDLSIDDVNLYPVFALDAAAISIDAPLNPISVGLNPVSASILNYGTDTLTSATLNWGVDGNVQTPVNWNGTLPSGQIDGPVALGSYTFNAGLSTIKAWTTGPNGAADANPGNDTVTLTVCTPLRGVYSLGGPTADIADFTQLTFLLETCGVDSHVLVNVNPGVYGENFNVGPIPGSAITATVTIDGGDTTQVRLWASQGSTVGLFGADYVTLKKITIQNTGLNDVWGVNLKDTAEWNAIDSCHIYMSDALGTLDCIGVGASNSTTSSLTEGQNALWTTISNNHIQFGEQGIHFEGQSALRNVGNRFLNNWIDRPEDYGFYIDDQDSISISGNTIEGIRAAGGDGMYLLDLMQFNISYNKIIDAKDWAFYLSDGNYDGVPSSPGKIINNMISSTSDYGMYLDDVTNTNIWHNSVYNKSTTTPAFYANDIFPGVNIQNNIFYSDGDYAYEVLDASSSNANHVLDHNLYYTTVASGTKFVDDGPTTYSNLALWQAAVTGSNANSVESDPVFNSVSDDLHVLGMAANDAGNNAVAVLDDIDGEVRPQSPSTTVDIGADEYTPLSTDGALAEFLAPLGQACGDSFTEVWVAIRNMGQDTIFTANIGVNVSGDISTSITLVYNDTLPFNTLDTVLVGTLNTFGGGYVNFQSYINLVGDQNLGNDTLSIGPVAFIPHDPEGITGYGCGTDSAFIYAKKFPGVLYDWYVSSTDTVPIITADSLWVPSITNQSTYYLQYADGKDSLETTFAQNNGCGSGNMFDITAINDINITSWVGHIATPVGQSEPVDIYYKVGTYAGSQSSSAAWTLLGSVNVTSNGLGVPTPVDVGNTLTIPAGATYGIYFNANVRYTNGNQVFSNGDLSLSAGMGHCTDFSGGITGRIWNGRVIYGAVACSDVRVPVTAVQGVAASVNIGPDTTLCDTSFILDAGNPAAQWWMWNNGDMTQMSTVSTSGMVDVTIKDTNNCFASDTAMVTIAGLPQPIDIGPDTLLCDGDSITLDAGAGFASYNWSSGGTAQTETTNAAGTVTVIGTDSFGCTSSDDVILSVLNTPTASFTSDSAATGCPAYDFMDTSIDSPTSWSWDFGDAVGTSTQQNPSYTYTGNGSYTVTLTVGNACGTNQATGTVDVSCLVSISDPMLVNAVSIYPNPNHGTFQVELDASLKGDYDLRVVNLHGQEVFAKSILNVIGMVKEEISLIEIEQGVYFVEVALGDRRVVHKIVVE